MALYADTYDCECSTILGYAVSIQTLLRPRDFFMLLRVFLTACVSTASLTSLASRATAANPDRPNILFIMSDDHTAQAVGAYATTLKSLDPTPTIDTLAESGIVFENAFCTNAICTPSRACIITGQYNHINGVFDLGGKIAPPKQALPILMRDAGYQTAIIGIPMIAV